MQSASSGGEVVCVGGTKQRVCGGIQAYDDPIKIKYSESRYRGMRHIECYAGRE